MAFTMKRRLRTELWAILKGRQRMRFPGRGPHMSGPLVGEPGDEYVMDAKEW